MAKLAPLHEQPRTRTSRTRCRVVIVYVVMWLMLASSSRNLSSLSRRSTRSMTSAFAAAFTAVVSTGDNSRLVKASWRLRRSYTATTDARDGATACSEKRFATAPQRSSTTVRWMGSHAAGEATTAAGGGDVAETAHRSPPTPEEMKSPVKKKKTTKMRRILSGVQPTGSLHLGNYLGAIRQWVDFQNNAAAYDEGDEDGGVAPSDVVVETENFFCVVDLHAITMPHDPKELAESTLASAALYLAAGIDPSKSTVFVQSHVPAHAELAWLLNCVIPMNWLERMIQYKDKSKKSGGGGSDSVGVGLFTYPALMAADILLYQATAVPVGEDQRQHLELTRDVCRRFRDLYCKGNPFKKRCRAAGIPSRPTFTEPEAMIVKTGARIMSLTDGTSKMSKSDPADSSRINVLDPPAVIRNKIKKCKTDSFAGLEWDNPDRPEATNLLNIYAAVSNKSREDILLQVRDMSWGEFKPILADAIIDHLAPIQERYRDIRRDDDELRRILAEGAATAAAVADSTLRGARVAMGFALPTTPSHDAGGTTFTAAQRQQE